MNKHISQEQMRANILLLAKRNMLSGVDGGIMMLRKFQDVLTYKERAIALIDFLKDIHNLK